MKRIQVVHVQENLGALNPTIPFIDVSDGYMIQPSDSALRVTGGADSAVTLPIQDLVIIVGTKSGPFTIGETVTGSVSGATGLVVSQTTNAITVQMTSTTQFVNSDTITGGTSHATITSITSIATITIPIGKTIAVSNGLSSGKVTVDAVGGPDIGNSTGITLEEVTVFSAVTTFRWDGTMWWVMSHSVGAGAPPPSTPGIPYVISPSGSPIVPDPEILHGPKAPSPVYRLAIPIATVNGLPVAGDLTEGTITITQVRDGVANVIVNAQPCSKTTGLIYYDYDFPDADWQDGDQYQAAFSGQNVTIGVTTYPLPPVYLQGYVEGVTSIVGAVDDGTPTTVAGFATNLPSTEDNFYRNYIMRFMTGACKGQIHTINEYTGGIHYAAFAPNDQWTTAPSDGDIFILIPSRHSDVMRYGILSVPVDTSLTIESDVEADEIDVGAGATLVINGFCQIYGDLSNEGTTILGDTKVKNLNNSGDLTINGNLQVFGAISNDPGSTITVTGNCQVAGALTNDGTITIAGDCQIAGGLVNNGSMSIVGNLDVDSITNGSSSAISIGGYCKSSLGISNDGTITINGDCQVDGGVTNGAFNDTAIFQVDGNCQIVAGVTPGPPVLRHGTLDNSGTVQLNGNLQVDAIVNTNILVVEGDCRVLTYVTNTSPGSIAVSGDCKISGNLTNTGAMVVTQDLYVYGTLSNSGTLTYDNLNPIDSLLSGIPAQAFYEMWELGSAPDPDIWEIVESSFSTWTIYQWFGHLCAFSFIGPWGFDTCGLSSMAQWEAAPPFGVNSIPQKLILEFELRLVNPAGLDGAATLLGFSPGQFGDFSDTDIIGFGIVGGVLVSVTDNGGVRTTNTGFGEDLTAWNKLKIVAREGAVDFYINGALVATHTTNIPNLVEYLDFWFATLEDLGASIGIGQLRCYYK